MDYFFAPPHLIGRDHLTIEGDEFSHLTHVMRKKPGDTIMVVDGAGNAFEATILDLTRHQAACRIEAHHRRLHEPDIAVHLAVALLKNTSNYDFLVEKCTELGVVSITPLHTERTIPRQARADRWQKIALAAMKQSGRCVLPVVTELVALDEFLDSAEDSSIRLIPHEKSTAPFLLNGFSRSPGMSVAVCIGPEGGFTDDEVKRAEQKGFTPVRLGQTRLRTETAAVVAAALCLHAGGD